MQVRDKLSGYFMQRITGNSLEYARLCVYYCKHVRSKMEYLDAAEKICLNCTANECHDLLQQIYCMKIEIIGSGDDIIDLMLENDGFDENEYAGRQYAEMRRLAEEAYRHVKEYTNDAAYRARFCAGLATELDSSTSNNFLTMSLPEGNTAMDVVLDFAVLLLDDAEEYILKSGMDLHERETLFNKMAEFFNPDNFSNIYKSEKYYNMGKVVHYQELIDSFRDKDEDDFYIGMAGIKELAEEAERKKEYQKAIELYYKAISNKEEPYDMVLPDIANVYLKMGEKEHAIECLEEVLRLDCINIQKNNGLLYTDYACCKLIDLLIEEKRYKEAKKYAEELILYNPVKTDNENNIYNIKWLSVANYRLYKMETSLPEKKRLWENCIMYYNMIPEDEEIPEESIEFLIEMAGREEDDKEKIKMAYRFLDRINFGYNMENISPFLDYILGICKDKEELTGENIKALLTYSHYWKNAYPKQEGKELEYCMAAKEQYEKTGIKNPYLYSLIYKTLAECYSDIGSYDYDEVNAIKKKCNYYLLAENDAQGKTTEKQIEIWKDTAYNYRYLDNYVMEEKCYGKLAGIIEPVLNQHDYSSFDNYWYIVKEQIECYLNLGKKDKAKETVLDIYYKMTEFYTKTCDEEDNGRKTSDFRWKLKDCAEYMNDGGFIQESLIFYIIAVIISIDICQTEEFLNNIEKYISGNLEELYKVFYEKLHGEISAQNIDDVIDIYEETQEIFEKDIITPVFYNELKWFSGQYQHQEVEFKR